MTDKHPIEELYDDIARKQNIINYLSFFLFVISLAFMVTIGSLVRSNEKNAILENKILDCEKAVEGYKRLN